MPNYHLDHVRMGYWTNEIASLFDMPYGGKAHLITYFLKCEVTDATNYNIQQRYRVSGGTRAVSGEQKKSMLSNYSNKLSKFRTENRKIVGPFFIVKMMDLFQWELVSPQRKTTTSTLY